jgi:hypothetical protein
MGMLSKAKLALQNYRFKLWRLRHPQATFKDYFAVIAKDVARTAASTQASGAS